MTKAKNKPELLPCPFCGCGAQVVQVMTTPTLFNVECVDCCCETATFDTRELAINHWNTRASTEKVNADGT